MILVPYKLVRVQHRGYSHVGEIISHPTPDNTVMCRMVPGDPSTMIEIEVSKLGTLHFKPKWVHYAEVAGSWQFPLDMLRYDFAAPVNFTIEEDEHCRITTVLKEGEETLIIARATPFRDQPWTHGRWRSFGWGLKEMKTLKI